MNFYRPRGALARAIYERFHVDAYLDGYDTRLWYTLNSQLPDELQSKFLPLLQPDETTVRWLVHAKLISAKIWVNLWHIIARTVLKLFMTQTDINGFLRRGSMFILSEQQFETLLRAGGMKPNKCDIINMLDIGAGDGEISIRLLSALESIHNAKVRAFATETSWTMRGRLKKHNFHVIERIVDIENVQLISCLNVLDRCIDPFELLRDIHNSLAPDGRVIIALVLPYVHYVEFNSSHLPLQPLFAHWPAKAKQYSFETEATMFFELLEELGFRIEAWTKAPYLCEGDLRQSFYWLIDLVVVLSKKPARSL